MHPSGGSPGSCSDITVAVLTAFQVRAAYLAFDGAAIEGCFFDWAPPKSWDGNDVTLQLYWRPSTSDTGDVYWQVGAGAHQPGDASQGYSSDVDLIQAAGGSQYQLNRTSEATITIAGSPVQGDFVQFQIKRRGSDASDIYDAVDAWLVGAKLRYTTDASTDD